MVGGFRMKLMRIGCIGISERETDESLRRPREGLRGEIYCSDEPKRKHMRSLRVAGSSRGSRSYLLGADTLQYPNNSEHCILLLVHQNHDP
jgi:hypothetical protein